MRNNLGYQLEYPNINLGYILHEPVHGKTNNFTLHPVMTQSSLDSHPVW